MGMPVKCGNCGKMVDKVCSSCWRCKNCCDCKEKMAGTIDGTVETSKKS